MFVFLGFASSILCPFFSFFLSSISVFSFLCAREEALLCKSLLTVFCALAALLTVSFICLLPNLLALSIEITCIVLLLLFFKPLFSGNVFVFFSLHQLSLYLKREKGSFSSCFFLPFLQIGISISRFSTKKPAYYSYCTEKQHRRTRKTRNLFLCLKADLLSNGLFFSFVF